MKFVCSDSDYSFTLRARGWKIFVVPSAHVTHEPDGAKNYKNPMIEEQKDRDHLYFMKKWLTGNLFRDLSAEGPTLTSETVQQRYADLNYLLQRGYE